jgi:hypothetical protein
MFNAYLYYLAPLVVASVFFLGGLGTLRDYAQRRRDPQGRKHPPAAIGCGMLLTLIGGGIGVAILLFSPTPWQREALFAHIFHTPPEQIVKVTLTRETNMYKKLVTRPIIITGRGEIQAIARALGDAAECSPNHPIFAWRVRMTLTTAQGEFSFVVGATSNGNGTLVSVITSPERGWNLGDFRVDELRSMVERAAAADRASP